MLKKLLVLLLTLPAACHDAFWEPWRRVWRLARIRRHIQIDASCVLTGTLHIIGSKAVQIAAGGYFYRDIHLETQEQGRITGVTTDQQVAGLPQARTTLDNTETQRQNLTANL